MVVTTPSRSADSTAPRYLRAPVPVHFPVEEVVPQTRRHLAQRTLLFEVLKLAFQQHAAIGCNQFVYWDPTDPGQHLAPDAFIRLGVPDWPFECWKVWERGAPEVAVEILSNFDARDRDLNANLQKYRRLGVRELVFFDPEQGPPSLRVWEAVNDDLVERAVAGHVAQSRCLPATWVVVPDAESGTLLRLSHDAEGKHLLPTPAEFARWRADLEREKLVQAEKRSREREP